MFRTSSNSYAPSIMSCKPAKYSFGARRYYLIITEQLMTSVIPAIHRAAFSQAYSWCSTMHTIGSYSHLAINISVIRKYDIACCLPPEQSENYFPGYDK